MSVKTYRNDLIKGAMAANDITVEKLRELTGLSTDTLRRIRAGEINITLSNLMTVASALELSLVELFTPKADRDGAVEHAVAFDGPMPEPDKAAA